MLRIARHYGIVDIQFLVGRNIIDGLILPICINNSCLRSIIIDHFRGPKAKERLIQIYENDSSAFRLFIAYLCYEKVFKNVIFMLKYRYELQKRMCFLY